MQCASSFKHVYIVYIVLYLTILTMTPIAVMSQNVTEVSPEIEEIQEELEIACCAIPEVDCSFVLSRTRTRQKRNSQPPSENSFDDLDWSNDADQPITDFFSGGMRRLKRQTILSDRFIDQLGINLLRFESCLCQSTVTPSACRMLFPPEFYKPNIPAAFHVVYQEEELVKRFACTFYSGSTVDCTLMSVIPFETNSTEEVQRLVLDKVEASGSTCIMCNPLYCTFGTFKRRIDNPLLDFNGEFAKCVTERSRGGANATVVETVTTGPLTPPTTSRPPRPPRPVPLPTAVWTPPRVVLRTTLKNIIFPHMDDPRNAFPPITSSGILSGMNAVYKETNLRERYDIRPSDLPPSLHHDDHDDHDSRDHGISFTAVVGAIIGGLILGAILMALIILILYRNKLFTKNVQLNRSLRGLPIVKMDVLDPTPYCGPSVAADIVPPPVARVVPITVAPRRPSLPIPLCTTFSGGHVNPMLRDGRVPEEEEDEEESNCRGIYSSVDELEDLTVVGRTSSLYSETYHWGSNRPVTWAARKTSRTIVLNPEELEAHYEVPVIPEHLRAQIEAGKYDVIATSEGDTQQKEQQDGSTLQSTTDSVPSRRDLPALPIRSDDECESDVADSDWSDSTTWDDEERKREIAALENDYMEIQPEPLDETTVMKGTLTRCSTRKTSFRKICKPVPPKRSPKKAD